MQEAEKNRLIRFLRFTVWALLMLNACQATAVFAPHRVNLVPVFSCR
jgi:hypothetical protein